MDGVVALDPVVQTQRRLLKPGWPLFVLFVGFPIWWALGLGGFIWPVMAFPMLLSLLRRNRIYAPPGMLLWVGFLVWMFATGVEIDSMGRALGFAYRGLVYLSATILLLYVFNSSRDVLQTRKVIWALSIFWIYVVIGGFLGLLLPNFSFTSPVEAALPHSILNNDFVKEMVHPAFAQVQDFLGFPTPRPSAPFVYTNDWGGAFALLVPFVILAWQTGLRRRFKLVLACAAAASIIPVVFSMNRGLVAEPGGRAGLCSASAFPQGQRACVHRVRVGRDPRGGSVCSFTPLGQPSPSD